MEEHKMLVDREGGGGHMGRVVTGGIVIKI
jgi:hypothetical protein